MKFIMFPFPGHYGDKFFQLDHNRWHVPYVLMRDKLLAEGHSVQVFPAEVDKENDVGIYFDSPEYPAPLTKRSICIMHEPPVVKPRQYERINGLPFTRILTHVLQLTNDKNIFYCPNPLVKPLVTYEPGPRSKHCVAIYSNKVFHGPGELYTARRLAILSFGKDVDLYGPGWEKDPEILTTVNYCGKFNGPKVEVMKDYKYAIAFDNMYSDGYCSEKLPDAINAGCIPIHRGWMPDYPFEQAYEEPWVEYVLAHIKAIL